MRGVSGRCPRHLGDAKKARAELIVEVSRGRHTGSRATVDDLFADWIVELQRKGRSPNPVDGYGQALQRASDRDGSGSRGRRRIADRAGPGPGDRSGVG